MQLKQNTQFEASKKGMFDEKGVEEFENCIQKQESFLLEVLQTGIDRLFFVCFVSLGDITANKFEPLGLIEKRRLIGEHDIHPNERVFFSKKVEEVGMHTHCSKVWSKLRTKRI
jgi:hypothetical protein